MTDPESKPPVSFATSLVAGGILIIVAGQAYMSLTPPVYQATALVSFHRWTKESEGMNAGEEKLAAEECPAVTSLDNLHALVQDPDLRKMWAARDPSAVPLNDAIAVTKIRQRLMVRARPKSLSIEIRVVSDDRNEPAKIANTLAAIYADYRSNQVNDLNSSRVAVYSRETEEQVKKITEAKSRMDELYIQIAHERATNQKVDYDQDAYDLMMTSARKRHVELESELGTRQRQLSEYQAMNSNDLIQVLSTTETNDFLNALLVKASRAKSSLASVSQDHGPDSTEVKNARAALLDLDSEIIRQVQATLAGKEVEIASTKSALSNLDQKLRKASTNSFESSGHFAEYKSAREEFNRLVKEQASLDKVANESMHAKVEPFVLNYIPTVIQPADIPAHPFVPDPKIKKMSVLGGGAAILLGLLLHLFRRTRKAPAAPAQKK